MMNTGHRDPLLVNSRREATFTAVIFLATLTYTLVYCSLHGYERPLEELTFVLGFPDWVFWGIVAPWLAAFTVSSIFAFWFMRDDPFGEDVGDVWAEESLDAAGPHDG